MPIERITADALRDMEHQEGLVLQGCGGEVREWLDGINGLLTQDGIPHHGRSVPQLRGSTGNHQRICGNGAVSALRKSNEKEGEA